MRYIVFLLLHFSLFADTSFITQMEYSSSIYKNPRGIGCQHCHGDNGEGKVVATYIHKKEKRVFAPPAINNMHFKEFYKALNHSKLTTKLLVPLLIPLYIFLSQRRFNLLKSIFEITSSGGLLARVGQRMIESFARTMMDRFFTCLQKSVR